jgi:hypothetical protein
MNGFVVPCRPVGGDVLCGCLELVQSDLGCRVCIDSVESHGINTIYVSLLSIMEYF